MLRIRADVDVGFEEFVHGWRLDSLGGTTDVVTHCYKWGIAVLMPAAIRPALGLKLSDYFLVFCLTQGFCSCGVVCWRSDAADVYPVARWLNSTTTPKLAGNCRRFVWPS